MTIKETVELMLSEDYRERFRAEYHQTKIRYEKLHQMCVKYEAGALLFEPTCGLELLKQQKAAMVQYLYYLEMRAELEHIDLEAPISEEETECCCGECGNHCQEQTCDGAAPIRCHSFGEALEHIKRGGKASRTGWLAPSFIFKIDITDFHTEADLSMFNGIEVDVCDQLAKWVDESVSVGWVPSQEEMLAEDWVFLD